VAPCVVGAADLPMELEENTTEGRAVPAHVVLVVSFCVLCFVFCVLCFVFCVVVVTGFLARPLISN